MHTTRLFKTKKARSLYERRNIDDQRAWNLSFLHCSSSHSLSNAAWSVVIAHLQCLSADPQNGLKFQKQEDRAIKYYCKKTLQWNE